MTSLIFMICMFACRIQFRILQNISNQHKPLTKIGTITICMSPLMLFLNFPNFICVFALILNHIFLKTLPVIFEWSKLRNAHLVCISALTKIVLSMQIGDSFRTSLESLIIHEKDPYWREQWSKVYDAVAFTTQELKHRSPFIRRFGSDLIRCDQVNFRQTEQIKQIRELYQKEFDFRRRSGQSLMQLRLQAMILFGLHIAVSLFMIHQFGWSPYKLVYIASFVLMLMGLIILMKMGGAAKWKV